MSIKQFISKLSLFTFPILLILISVNYFGDAARLFDKDYEKKLAQLLVDGNNVTNIANFDERLLQKEIIKITNDKKETIIFGSSRSMLINRKVLCENKIFNNSVSGASLEDIIAIYQIYKIEYILPKKIIIGIDPWIFNNNNNQKRWESISNYYYRFLNKENISNNNKRFLELLSLSYFQNSIKIFLKGINGKSDPVITEFRLNKKQTKLAEGSLVYGEEFRSLNQTAVDYKMKKYITGEIYSLGGFDEVSDIYWHQFQLLISEIQKQDIEIQFFLPPYAPIVYDLIDDKYPLVSKTEILIRDFARKQEIGILGSYNPVELGLDKTHFYDGMHLKENGLYKIFNNFCKNNP